MMIEGPCSSCCNLNCIHLFFFSQREEVDVSCYRVASDLKFIHGIVWAYDSFSESFSTKGPAVALKENLQICYKRRPLFKSPLAEWCQGEYHHLFLGHIRRQPPSTIPFIGNLAAGTRLGVNTWLGASHQNGGSVGIGGTSRGWE